jgi:hypothetical protein
MDLNLNQIAEFVGQIPLLLKDIEQLKQENQELRQKPFLKEVLDAKEVAAYARVTIQTARIYMDEIGCSRIGKKLYVKREDLIDYLMSNRRMSKEDIETAADNYEMKRKAKI